MENKANLFTEANDFNICKSWLCDSTDGETYSLCDWFGAKIIPFTGLKNVSNRGYVDITQGVLDGEWDDRIGYKHDYLLDDPKVDEEARAMAARLNEYIDGINKKLKDADVAWHIVEPQDEKDLRENRAEKDMKALTKDTTVRNFLNLIEDEVWVELSFDNINDGVNTRPPMYVWGADWIGGLESTLSDLEPWLDDYVVDEMYIVEKDNPENAGEKVLMIHVSVYDKKNGEEA